MAAQFIDLRSDTVTRPTPEMRRAMYEAEVGDDVLGEDPTTNKLEKLAAELLGKEKTLFVPSGTFGNQAAIFTHCGRGSEVILSEKTHIVQHEVGASAVLASVQLRTMQTQKEYPSWGEIDRRVRKREDIHYPSTGLIVLENALSDGEVMPLDAMNEIYDSAMRHAIPVHLDGARIFNAASYLGVEARSVGRCTDSVMFCLSKGLCAPVGSLLAGEEDFIRRARIKRKLMGGGMRQCGILSAAGLVALRTMTDRVDEDRQKAELLAENIQKLGLFQIKPEKIKINMFFLQFKAGELLGAEALLVSALKNHNILIYPPEDGRVRFVTHHDVTFEDIEKVISRMSDILQEVRDNRIRS